jgi:hypothetical protein
MSEIACKKLQGGAREPVTTLHTSQLFPHNTLLRRQ